MKYLCKNIQGCVFGYTQSDEITLILIDYQTLTTDAWFDYEVQKLCSVSASMATMAFNKFFRMSIWDEDFAWKSALTPQSMNVQIAHNEYIAKMTAAANKGALFDARCFNIPKEEVCNLIYWRQLDATRNSIQMVGKHISYTSSWKERNAMTFRTCWWSSLTSTGIITQLHASVALPVSTRMGNGYLILKCRS